MSENGKSYLVIGGSSGIGQQIVRLLEADGSSVVVASRKPGDVEDTGLATGIRWDVTNGELPTEGLPETLDGLVYCPGTINLKPFQRLTDKDFQEDFDVNLLGAVRAIRASLPALKRAEPPAAIVLFSTVAVARGMPFHASLGSAKGAVEGLCRALAAELAPSIRVNTIAPSLTDTPLAARLLSSPERRERSAQQHPLGRVGRAEEIAWLATRLLGDEMSWATGQVFHLDGGLSTLRTS
jgi:3-oxoacyl-[acyl-carrier protein] reductase